MKSFQLLSQLFTLAALGNLAPTAVAAEPFRLDRIGIVRFTEVGPDRIQRSAGTLMLEGHIAWSLTYEQDRPANVPPWIFGRTLVLREAWLAYRALGFTAVANFVLGAGSVAVPVGDSSYWVVEPNPEARYSDGRVVNISTRARLAGAGDAVIAGFVIEGRHRTVLIRGVGPGLASLGVPGALADPIIGVRRGQTIRHYNDDWSTRYDAAKIRAAAARVGAFPLADGSKDAALLVELPPGAYTVSVESAGPAINGGEVLVEVYSVSELD